jgi:hypothetical protein
MHTTLQSKHQIEDHLKNLDIDENNIKMDLKPIWYESVDWIHLADDRKQWRIL